MGETTAIQWTHVPGYIGGTWNWLQGCHKKSAGCKNCYMYRDMLRYGKDPTKVIRSAPATFNRPLYTKDPHAWFSCSWGDFFCKEGWPWIEDAWSIIRQTPQHLYLVLTKEASLIHDGLPEDWGDGYPNVWLGVTVENDANRWRLEALCEIPAAKRFVSYEPAIGPVFALPSYPIDWVICGGESGPGARPLNLDWARSVRDDCVAYHTPFFFKQIGGTKKIDGTWGGHLLDGQVWQQFPEAK